MDWSACRNEWDAFVEELRAARLELRCSYSHAWFRGHADADNYRLEPSLLRRVHTDDPELAGARGTTEGSIAAGEQQLRAAKAEIRRVREAMREAKQQEDTSTLELLAANLQRAREDRRLAKTAISRAISELRALTLPRRGEREALMSYGLRAGGAYGSSWETLADMRHHGVPTRLLDWTENLSVALAFGVVNFTALVDAAWGQRSGSGSEPLDCPDVTSISTAPSIWVLNPYEASRHATGRAQVWDVTVSPGTDYYQAFLEARTWPFEKPVPIFAPWRSPRLAWQQGYFTVSGHDTRPLDQIFPPSIVREIRMSPGAALHAALFLREILGVDRYFLFRDLDALGHRVTRDFF